MTHREQLRRFVSWLIGKHSQAEIDHTDTGRSFRRLTAWCWDVQPRLPPTETVYYAVMLDGLWSGTWCLLIALSDSWRKNEKEPGRWPGSSSQLSTMSRLM